ncbi:alpha/beta hydrolase [Amycolatopsis anabasis]|uniref:alpha/beta hydrolase n=1 Tax=Amycolatopsis anabasis TaxID=1840409 RepID=UPI00131D72CE|nr:alpha/beta fold hydrolase [Amycolatopsis anabasis]
MAEAEPQTITFFSQGERCSAWLYRATQSHRPCVVMAHGFGAVKAMRLYAYATEFCRAGFNVLAFDYRHFGDSQGEPRQLLDITKQVQDWHAALSWVRDLCFVDKDKIILWGTSFSGGHVARVGAQDQNIAAIVSQVPYFSGPSTVVSQGIRQSARLGVAGLRDIWRQWRGRQPYYLPTFGYPGSLAAMTGSGEYEAAQRIYPPEVEVRSEVAARIFLHMAQYSPGKHAVDVRCPWLIQIASQDITTPPGPARRIARQAPRAQLIEYKAGHFEPYTMPLFAAVVGDQINFLRSHTS